MYNYFLVLIDQTKQEGSPPGESQEAKPKHEEGRESARPSRPAVSRTMDTHKFSSATAVSSLGVFYMPLLFFSATHLVLSFFLISVALSLPSFNLQSYKKAIDEVSDT